MSRSVFFSALFMAALFSMACFVGCGKPEAPSNEQGQLSQQNQSQQQAVQQSQSRYEHSSAWPKHKAVLEESTVAEYNNLDFNDIEKIATFTVREAYTQDMGDGNEELVLVCNVAVDSGTKEVITPHAFYLSAWQNNVEVKQSDLGSFPRANEKLRAGASQDYYVIYPVKSAEKMEIDVSAPKTMAKIDYQKDGRIVVRFEDW